MPNALLTPSIIAKEALMQLENNLVMANLVHRQYVNEFHKVGDTITIRKPVRFTVVDGSVATAEDVQEGSTTLQIASRKNVSWSFNTQDLTLTIDQYSERYITPAMIALANQVDRDVLGLYSSIPSWVGTPGQTINSFADLSAGPQRLDEMAVPKDNRRCVLAPADSWGMIGNLSGLNLGDSGQNSPQASAYREARLGRVAGLDIYQDQNVRTHTVGVGTGTPVISGASQLTTYANVKTTNQMALVTKGWTASKVLKAGDVFTIDSVFAVNPVSKDTLDFLQPFTLTADVTTNATTTSNTTLNITPAIITTGSYQTVSAGPADAATITYVGTASTGYRQNMVFHKNAFALVTVPLIMPDSAVWKARQTHNGLSVRLYKYLDGDNDIEKIRCDILYGTKAIYPELATRISGAA